MRKLQASSGVPLRVLLVEDSENDAMLLLRELRRGGYEPVYERVYTPEDMRRALQEADASGEPFELVVSDYYMPRFRAPEALELLRELGYDVPFIVVSGKIGEDAAVGIMKAGANDYLTKENMSRLCPALGRELKEAEVRRERERAEEALGRSEIRFRRLVEQAADAVFVHDLEGRLMDVNRQACESLGYSREELLGISVADFEVGYEPGSLQGLWELISSGTPRTLEGTHRRKDGTTFPVEVRVGVFESGEQRLLLALARDITERKRAEKKVREAEARYRTLVEQLPAVTYVQEPFGDKRVSYVSPQVETVLGYPADRELLDPDHWINIMHPDDRERVLEEDRRTDETGEPFRAEYRQFTADGKMVWIRDEATLVRDEEGRPIYWQGVQYDITDQKLAEGELRRSEVRYRTFIEQSTEGIWRFELEEPMPTDLPDEEQLDRFYRHAYLAECNDAMARMYGYERASDIVGVRVDDFLPRTDPRNVEFLLAAARGGYRLTNAESRELDREGNIRFFVNNLTGIIEEGRLVRVWGTQRDITEQKRAEQELQVGENRLRVAVESTGLGTWDFDPLTWQVRWDDRAKAVFGLSPEADVAFETFLAAIHPDDRERVKRVTERAMNPAGDGRYEAEYRTVGLEDGVERWVAARGQALFEDGRTVRFVGTVLDVTEQREAEDQLARLASFPELNPYPIVETNVAGEPTYLNPAAQAHFPDLRAMGAQHPMLVDLEGVNQGIWSSRGRPFVREVRVGESVYQQILSRTPEGGLLRIYATDITERKRAEDALRQSEERFRSLVQNASDIIMILDESGDIRYESPAVERVLGFKPEERVGKNAFDLIHPDDRERLAGIFAGRRESPGSFAPVEYRVRDRWGSWRSFEAVGENLLDDPIIRGIVVNSRDITERKRAEEALRQSEELLRTVVTNAPVVLFSLDPEGTFTLSTGRGLEALGLEPDELAGRSVFEVYEDHPGVLADVRRALSGEEFVGTSEVEGVVFETWYGPVHGEDGAVTGVIGVATDVTERTEAEEGLRRTLKDLADLKFALDESAIVAITDRRGRITYVNDKFCEVSGYSRDELLGHDHHVIDSGFHPKEYIRNVWRTVARGRVWRGELKNRAKDGSIYWVDTTIVPFLDERGKPYQYVAVRYDITGRKGTEEALREAEARYRTLVEQVPAVIYVDAVSEGYPTTYISPQAEALTGHAPEEYLSDPGLWKDVIHPDDRERVVSEFDRAATTGDPFSEEYRLIARDGRSVWVRDEAVLVRDQSGAPLFWQGVQLDVTEQRRAEEERRKSEERFRAAFDQAAVGMSQVGLDGSWLRVNRRLCEIIGYDEEELLGLTFQDITHPEDLDKNLDNLRRMLADDISTYATEKRYFRKDGAAVWINLTVSLVREPSGEPAYFISVTEDITERKRAEEALRQSEERFRNLADNISQLAWMADETGFIFWYNRRWFDYTGTTLEDMAGWGWQKVHPEHVDRVVERIQRSWDTGEPWEDTFPLRGADGTYRWFLSRALPIRDGEGRIVRWFGTNTDVTEQREAEEALKQSEELYRSVIEQAAENIFLVDIETMRILEVNAALSRSLGYTEEELERMTLYEVVAHDRESVDRNTEQVLREGRLYLGERRYRRKDGTFADVEVNVSSIPYGGRRAMCVVAHDVTERRRVELALRDIREAERNRIARELHDSILQDIVYALQEIQVIQVTSQNGDDPALQSTAEALRRSVEGLRGAIFELRLKETLDRSLASSLENLVDLNRRMARGRYELDLVVGEDVPARLPERVGREIVRIVQEALTNVRRHAEARHVRVEIGLDDDLLYAEVSDDGRGFDPGVSRTGMGRYSMRQRALELGGRIEIESEPGRGTRVRLGLPLSRTAGE